MSLLQGKKGLVVTIAKECAKEEDWPWGEPIEVKRVKSYRVLAWLFGAFDVWSIRTNIRSRGCNITILVDVNDAKIKGKHILPR